MHLLSGGRGASSGTVGGGFGNAEGGKNVNIESLYPAELNLGVAKGNSVDSAFNRFKNKYGTANREYGVMLDRDGYALEHNKGEKHAVGFYTDVQDGTFIHNHPSGSNFSDTDLNTFANTKIKTLIATSSNGVTKGDYKITKTNHFDDKGFEKAVKNAKWDESKYSYNTGADWWLKKNADKYGYKYTSTGVQKAGKGENGW